MRERIGRRPHHVGAAALAAGLALAQAGAGASAVTAAAAAGSLALARYPRLALLAAALVLGGSTAGQARIAAIDRAAYAGPPGTAVSGRAVVLEHPRPSPFGSAAIVETESGVRLLARAPAALRWPDGGAPGTIVVLAGSTRAPRPGRSFDWPAYLRRRGIRSELAVESLRPAGVRRGGLLGAVDSLRRRAERALATGLSPSGAALARGMVLGEDERIDDLERDDFRRAGLAHVLAVSGQNVMLLCALALPLLGVAGAGPRTRTAVLLALVAVYVPLAGAGPSLQRAGAMAAAGLVAVGAGRPASRWYALLLAAVVTLAVNPRAGADPGWQLSFAAVAGILLLARPLQRALGGLPRALAEGVALTLAATVATAPLIAHHFGSVSLAGIVANVVALPLVAPIMWIGMGEAALVQLPPLQPLLAPLGAAQSLLIGLLRSLVRAFADAPGASAELPLRSPLALAAAYAILALAALVVWRVARHREPLISSAAAAWRRTPRRRRTMALAAAAALCAIGWTYAVEPPDPPGRLTVSFLDVGQGDATLIQDGRGAAVLFDGGPPEARVYRELRAAGVSRLDLMVSTHQSRDHQGGLHEVLERIPTGLLLENGYGTRDPDYKRLIAEAEARGVRHVAARAGQVLHVGRLTIRILGPRPRAAGEPPPEEPNPIGVAAIVSEGSFDLWLSADAESDAILQYPLRPVEAMKVSHHGSKDPGLPDVLRRLRPQVAAIEVGAGNSYGHPAPETLAALRAAVRHVYRTDRDGTVTLTVGEDRRATVRSTR